MIETTDLEDRSANRRVFENDDGSSVIITRTPSRTEFQTWDAAGNLASYLEVLSGATIFVYEPKDQVADHHGADRSDLNVEPIVVN